MPTRGGRLRTLRAEVRKVIVTFLDDGGGSAREIAETVCRKSPETIRELAQEIAISLVTTMVNKEIKRGGDDDQRAGRQLALPGVFAELAPNVPRAISIPTPNGPIYRRLLDDASGATIDESGLACQARREGIQADVRRTEEIEILVRAAQSVGLPGSTKLSVALREAARRGPPPKE